MIKDRSSEFRRKASEFLTNDPSISIDVESNISCTQNDSFFAEIDEIRNLMTKLSDDVSNVKMQLRSILARTIVDGNEKEKLDECMAGIKYRSSLLRKHLLTMKQNVKGSGSDNVIIGGINERIRQYHIEALIKKLSDLLEMFNAAQLDYRTQVSKRIKRQLDVAGEHMTDDEVNAMIDSNSMEIFNRRMRSSELKSVLNDASLRHNEIKNLEASIKELNDLYNDMAFLMQTQGDTVDRIDRCTSNAFNYVIAGNQQAQEMAESAELWRECVRWMNECGILDAKHRVTEANAEIGEFATILRDGVLLCLLCNRLCENCIDIKDLQQRPQMAQFLCCKNICEFLKACRNTFEMKPDDLFDPWDLYRLDDFGKVLRTLSKLSLSPVAKTSGVRGFPIRLSPLNSVEYYNDKVIYKNLRQGAEVNEPVLENAYDMGVAEEEKTSGQIYDSIVCQRSNSQRELKAIEHDKWTNFKPESRREHCVKELYDTESNYVEKALDMIINNFYTPLEEVLSKDDHKMIFMNILELACIHRSFRDHLRQAVFYTVGLEKPAADEKPVTIGDVFITWKEKFVAYGEYCSKLPNSRSRICYLEKTDPIVRQKIIDCGIAANRNQFHLQDLLSIPMQRVLKYHVLLSEMIKLTSVDSPDRLPLEEAKEAMQDINSYVNEMKRDYEMQQLVMDIESSITDLELPVGMHLINYGRLVKDGEIKIADQSKDGNRLKTRYVFIFDKVMIICKSLRGNQYSYRSAHILSDYRVDIDADNNNKIGTITRKLTANGSFYFSLVQELDDGVTNVLNICCKTMLQRDSWVQNIIAAQDNIRPKESEASGHCLQYHSYDKATVCFHCEKLLAGLFYQGYHCTDCKRNLHRACLSMSKCPGIGLTPARSQAPNRRKHTSSLQPHECVRAVQSFRSSDPLFLSFEMNDLIEITQRNIDGTLMGRVVAFPNRIGLIQAEFVRRFRISTSSLHMGSPTGTSFTNIKLPSPVDHCDSWISSPLLPRSLTSEERKLSSIDMVPPRKSQSQDYVNTEVVDQQWYRGPMKRWDAEELLRGTPDGTFLVRFSATQQKYVISISFNGDVKHTKVEQSPEGRYYLDESSTFASVVELINYYRENNLRESFETLNTTLRHSYTDKQSYIALHNFEASEPNFLALVVGQRVYVISRTGEDRGWWKGRSGNRVGYFPLAYVAPAEEA